MPILKDLAVFVVANGRYLPEYTLGEDAENLPNAVTRYLMSNTGDTIAVALFIPDSINCPGCDALSFETHFDGRRIYSDILGRATREREGSILDGLGHWVGQIRRAGNHGVEAVPFKFVAVQPGQDQELEYQERKRKRGSHQVRCNLCCQVRRQCDKVKPTCGRCARIGKECRYITPAPSDIDAAQSDDGDDDDVTMELGIITIKVCRVNLDLDQPYQVAAHQGELWEILPPAPVSRNHIRYGNLTHMIQLGTPEPVVDIGPITHYDATCLESGPEPWATFNFRYRSAKVLEQWNAVPACPDEAADETESNRSI